jgi:hypothetical protein
VETYWSRYTGVALSGALDQVAADAGLTDVGAISSGAKLVSEAGELIFGYGEGQGPLIVGGADFTVRSTDNSNIVEDRVDAGAGFVSADFSAALLPGSFVTIMATFRPAGGVDGGADGGANGVADGGVDGGVDGSVQRYDVRCGCDAPGGALGVMLLALLRVPGASRCSRRPAGSPSAR